MNDSKKRLADLEEKCGKCWDSMINGGAKGCKSAMDVQEKYCESCETEIAIMRIHGIDQGARMNKAVAEHGSDWKNFLKIF